MFYDQIFITNLKNMIIIISLITTMKVNISREIIRFKTGFIANNNVDSFSKALKKFNNLKKKDLNKLRINSLNCFKENFDLSLTKNSLGSVLKKTLKFKNL